MALAKVRMIGLTVGAVDPTIKSAEARGLRAPEDRTVLGAMGVRRGIRICCCTAHGGSQCACTYLDGCG